MVQEDSTVNALMGFPSLLKDKVLVVTGASGGIGRATVQVCLRSGARVVVVDVAEPDFILDNQSSQYFFCDVTQEDDWQELKNFLIKEYGKIDGLVNNAGIFASKSLEMTTPEEYDRVIAVNQRSTFLGMSSMLSLLKKAGGGSIVNISSVAALVGVEDSFAYTASKSAIRGMSRAAAVELAPFGIRVNAVLPGDTNTAMTRDLTGTGAASNFEMVPLGRQAEPEEIASSIAFLLSEAALYITGTEFVIDGGFTAL